MPGTVTEAEAKDLCSRWPGAGYCEEHYPEDEAQPRFFLRFHDTDRALAFCASADFDRVCLTMEKVES